MKIELLKTVPFLALSLLPGVLIATTEPGCPARVPLFDEETVSASWTYDALTKHYTYRYVVANPTTSIDYVNVFWLGGTGNSLVSLKAPDHWFPFQVKSSVMWAPIVGYSGNEIAIVSRPSDADIAPGQTLSGFSVTSVNPPSFLPYRIMPRRTVSGAPPSDASAHETEEDWESVLEEHLERCGATGGDVPEFARFGVTVGPAPSTIPFLPNLETMQSPQGLTIKLPIPSSIPEPPAPIDRVVVYNFEYKRTATTLDADKFVSTDIGLSVVLPQEAVSQFSCRTTAVLVEFQSAGKPVLRAKMPATALGLPRRCTESDSQ